ncbi:MAG: hypothetical protein WCJ56_04500 [bacterium]
MRFLTLIALVWGIIIIANAADPGATPYKSITILDYSVTTKSVQPLAPATPATFTLCDTNTRASIVAASWQYRLLGETAWITAATNASSITISFPGLPDTAAKYELKVDSAVPIVMQIDVAKAAVAAVKQVLFISVATKLNPAEELLAARFPAPAFVLTTKAFTSVTAADYTGKELIVSSSQVKNEKLAPDLKALAIPVIVMNFTEATAMSLSPGGLNNGGDAEPTVVDQTAISGLPASGDYTLIGGKGTLSFARNFNTTLPIGVLIIAKNKITNNASVYAVPSVGGLYIDGSPVPARRGVFHMKDYGSMVLSTDGLKVFDAVVQWCLATK